MLNLNADLPLNISLDGLTLLCRQTDGTKLEHFSLFKRTAWASILFPYRRQQKKCVNLFFIRTQFLEHHRKVKKSRISSTSLGRPECFSKCSFPSFCCSLVKFLKAQHKARWEFLSFFGSHYIILKSENFRKKQRKNEMDLTGST